MHVKHLNTIKPKREANNVGILLAFILRNKCVFPVLHSHWVLFSFLILRNLTCLYTPIFLRLRVQDTYLYVDSVGQLRVLRLSTGKDNFTWWEVKE